MESGLSADVGRTLSTHAAVLPTVCDTVVEQSLCRPEATFVAPLIAIRAGSGCLPMAGESTLRLSLDATVPFPAPPHRSSTVYT